MSRLHRAFKSRILLPALRRVSPERDATLEGFSLRVNLRDRIIGTRLWQDGLYEPEVLDLIRRMRLGGRVCIDVGANIGLHTLTMSETAAEVFAFEPEPYNFSLLKHNVEANARRNVRVFNCALGDGEGELKLARDPSNFGDHRIAAEGLPVRVTTVDEVLKDVPAGSVALVKMDVQGFEARVLAGMRRTLERNPDVTLLMEIFPEGLRQAGDTASGLVSALRSLGFDGVEVHPHRAIPLLAPEWYDTLDDGKDVNVCLSRSPLDTRALSRHARPAR